MTTTIQFDNKATFELPYNVGITVEEMLDERNSVYRVSIAAIDANDVVAHKPLFDYIKSKGQYWFDYVVFMVDEAIVKMNMVYIERQTVLLGYEFECALNEISFSNKVVIEPKPVIKKEKKLDSKSKSKEAKPKRNSTNKS